MISAKLTSPILLKRTVFPGKRAMTSSANAPI